jgi:RNA polymerase sigma-70 factor (sigma-E family)
VRSEAVEAGGCLQGSASQMATLYRLHAPEVGRLAYLLTGDADLAEDLAQEAFVRLMGRLGRIRDQAAIEAYLRRSIVNLARKHWRKRRSERAYLRGDGLAGAVATGALPDVAARDELWQALATLSYQQRAAIVLRFYQDLSEQETARVLGCAVGTVKSSVSRGLRQIREEMDDGEGV